MTIWFMLKLALAVVTLLFGLTVLIFPQRIAHLAGLATDNAAGRAEIRIGWGGLYTALGIGMLVLRLYPTVFLIVAFIYGGQAATRVVMMLVDPRLRTRNMLGFLTFEVVAVLICLSQSI